MSRRAIVVLLVTTAALVLSSGIALAVTRQCKTIDPNTGAGTCFGTKERDKLLGTDGHNIMFGKGSGDTLEGFGGGDILYGQGGGDKVIGGFGNDLLYPGPGNDLSDGSLGEDHYIIEADKWGKDTISISDTAAADLPDHLEFQDVGTQLTINLASNPNQDEVTNAAGTSTINWPDNDITILRSDNSGDDTVNGTPAADVIFLGFGEGGIDIVSAGGGNDFVDVRDGDPFDTVDCGDSLSPPGDEVHYDAPTQFSLGDSVTRCEELHPN
jgi:Ca2+-binding RTX toxin-like protein